MDGVTVVHSADADSVFGCPLRQRAVMTRDPDTIVTISTQSDVICAITQLLGFTPVDSVVALCTHGRRRRLGLAMRLDLPLADDPVTCARVLAGRIAHEGAAGAFVVVFSGNSPRGGELPHLDLVGELVAHMGDLLHDVVLTNGERWWSYLCADLDCCSPVGTPVNRQSPAATAIAAAYALAGQGPLPDRAAVVRSIAFDHERGEPDGVHSLITISRRRYREMSRNDRRAAVRVLLRELATSLADPHQTISLRAAAELTALCDDVVVRDEVLVRARKPRRRAPLLRVLCEVARMIPPPDDAAVCTALAWVAYASGNGVLANVALDRAFATDADYPLARLIGDALERQVPPWVLEDVMRGAERDLRGRSAAG